MIGWGEFELEVMRDRNDNVVIVCSIENVDPMGVHTGDSVTVAPQQTLTDRQYQKLRDQALAVIRAVGVETGGSNIQFAVNPETDEIVVIEMNPRVSRSSALASKATGFPIAKIAARLAVGYALEEIDNDITRKTPGQLRADDRLRGGQVAALRLREVPRRRRARCPPTCSRWARRWRSAARSSRPSSRRCARASSTCRVSSERRPARAARDPLARPLRADLRGRARGARRRRSCAGAPAIDPWFMAEIAALARGEDPEAGLERSLQGGRHLRRRVRGRDAVLLLGLRARGAATRCDAATAPSVVILGSGPNRIGQGIEFDYCCVHAAMTVRESGRDAVMVNCNPETVSTDYDTSRPALLRAADARGRARRWSSSSSRRA